ncbi:type II toxin-antitoxin system antitoxin SocA domain-containing protein [Sulfurospirillum sp. 1612]|uniref:type II toxin-antitoxin system antitoxin SocA domain-containing protein n=1 Tax=Sulfurospirillum sp. 1612 TaxID=3094835 RepID=UPI002F940C56
MRLDITKIAHVILYLLDEEVQYLNDKKLSILLFLMDYNHMTHCGEKIFGETYIKAARQPEPVVLAELFDIIANEEDLDEEDPRLFLIQELLNFLDIELIAKRNHIALEFIKMEESFDASLFSKEELKTIQKVTTKYHDISPRNIANECFKIEKVRESALTEVII